MKEGRSEEEKKDEKEIQKERKKGICNSCIIND
jgi:hypothetical protein